ncbi:hypothetical protein D3C76_1335650 [compost metagenome]
MRVNSAWKMISVGVRALCTKTMSRLPAMSQAARVIDIKGVTPEPADRYNNLVAGWPTGVKLPAGPEALRLSPGLRLSCSQFDTAPPGTRLTVMENAKGRVGEDDRV